MLKHVFIFAIFICLTTSNSYYKFDGFKTITCSTIYTKINCLYLENKLRYHYIKTPEIVWKNNIWINFIVKR